MGDVGQFTWEEINFQSGSSRGGENYGWAVREGRYPYQSSAVNPAQFRDPIYEILHPSGTIAIVGGFVYRGPASARMDGVYFFADFYSGRIFGLRNPTAVTAVELLTKTPYFISSFGEEEAGRLLLCDYISGKTYVISDNGRVAPPQFSSQSGAIYSNVVTVSTISPGAVIHYTLDGTDPTVTDAVAGPGSAITLNSPATVKARAFRDGLDPSDISVANFTPRVAAPTFHPPQGPLAEGTPVSLNCATPSAEIHFTVDGSDPTASSPLYSAAVPYDSGAIIKARAFKNGFSDSSVASFPVNPLRFQPIRTINYSDGTVLDWFSESGINYQLEFTDDLHSWFEVGRRYVGTGGTLSFTNGQVYPRREMRHFRLKSWQD